MDKLCCQLLTNFEAVSGGMWSSNPWRVQSLSGVFLHNLLRNLSNKLICSAKAWAKFECIYSYKCKSFLTLNLMTGIKKLNSYRDYWSSKLEIRDPLISSVMSRDRFAWLLCNLYLNDNSLQPVRYSVNFDKRADKALWKSSKDRPA